MEAMASLNPGAPGTEMLNGPSEQGNPPQESLPQNAQGGGADLMSMLQAAQGGVPQQGGQ